MDEASFRAALMLGGNGRRALSIIPACWSKDGHTGFPPAFDLTPCRIRCHNPGSTLRRRNLSLSTGGPDWGKPDIGGCVYRDLPGSSRSTRLTPVPMSDHGATLSMCFFFQRI
ncbi:hypothetical protein CGMCC3_g1073 [Colletotrichum fructicola]|nr:uncharacterized protein CGMCC3_g1073 [Colletotrichum fructicola]KAE9582952.1 hypothetical protein CGMCC3_g1073 [Colletotrichum fructicola]